jgi:hypothetical protein
LLVQHHGHVEKATRHACVLLAAQVSLDVQRRLVLCKCLVELALLAQQTAHVRERHRQASVASDAVVLLLKERQGLLERGHRIVEPTEPHHDVGDVVLAQRNLRTAALQLAEHGRGALRVPQRNVQLAVIIKRGSAVSQRRGLLKQNWRDGPRQRHSTRAFAQTFEVRALTRDHFSLGLSRLTHTSKLSPDWCLLVCCTPT